MGTARRRIAAGVVFIPLFLGSVNGNAQYRGGEIGLNGSMGIPQGEFGDNVENLGWGGSIYGGYNFPKTPIMIGIDIGYLLYGSESRREKFSTTIPDATVRVENTNNIFLGHFMVRLQPEMGSIKPYVDGVIGFKNLYTKTRIENESFAEEEIAESTNSSDYAFSYGVGGGLKIKVYEKDMPGHEDERFAIFADFGARYLPGSEAEYLKEGSITRTPEGDVYYDFKQSKTDLLLFNIGVSVLF